MPANDIESEAAGWLIRLEGDASAAARAEFEAWRRSDPRRQAAFLRLEKTWARADIMRNLRPLDGVVDERVLDGFGNSTGLNAQSRRHGNSLWLGATALMVALGTAAWLLLERSAWQAYTTESGGFQRIALADGSTAMLNTNSSIRVRLSASRREIVLERGEALFTVAHDARRPFDVSAGDTLVRAVGTEFSIRMTDRRQIDVMVTVGRVALNPADAVPSAGTRIGATNESSLTAGESGTVRAHRLSAKRKIDARDVSRKLAWTQGQIWLDGATLAQAVAEFNRYNRRQMVIDDPTIAGLHIGGSFAATDLDSFIAALATFGIRSISGPGGPDGPSEAPLHLSGGGSAR